MTSPPPSPAGIVKHSIVIAGHRTSISLEQVFWDGLKRIAIARGASVSSVVAAIDRERGAANLSSAIRVHVFLQGSADPYEATERTGRSAFSSVGTTAGR